MILAPRRNIPTKIGDTNSQICLEKKMLICMKEYVLDIGPDMFRADKFRLKLET